MKEFYQKTATEAMNELFVLGFNEGFQLMENDIVAHPTGKHYKPAELRIVKVYRFESDTDPSDNAELFAIHANDGHKGTMLLPYGAHLEFNEDLVRAMKYDA